jgi:hypothetical protein
MFSALLRPSLAGSGTKTRLASVFRKAETDRERKTGLQPVGSTVGFGSRQATNEIYSGKWPPAILNVFGSTDGGNVTVEMESMDSVGSHDSATR